MNNEIDLIKKYKIRVIKESDKEYPKRLKELKGMPKELFAIGNIDLLNNNAIAIVGSRDYDGYGKVHTKRFASFLAQKGLTIVSGLARGIDTFAHESSINKKGKTIAVIASGFYNIYPKENIKLAKEIIDNGGLIISEWEPNAQNTVYRFPQRNRIISGLSIATIVIESKMKSGSNITAYNAMKQGRIVFALPGDLGVARSEGTNCLIKDGAYPVSTPLDVLDVLKFEGYEFEENKIKVDEQFKDVYDLIETKPISVFELSRKINKTIPEIVEILFLLELDGFIKKDKDMYYKVESNKKHYTFV